MSTPGWGPTPARSRSGCTTAGTSGSAWRSSASPSPSTSATSCGRAARGGGWRDSCQVRKKIMFFKSVRYQDSLGIISPVASEDVRHKHSVAIGQYFYHNQRRNRVYGARFVICEVINVVNLVTQIFLIDSLLGGEFSTYGFKVKVNSGIIFGTDIFRSSTLHYWMMRREMIQW